jgi:hypothetical protein
MISGAVRCSDAKTVAYQDVCPSALKRLAETYREGHTKYTQDNWAKGMPIDETLNHAIRHIELYRNGDCTEDHLAHAVWNLFTVMHFEKGCKCHHRRDYFKKLDALYLAEQKKDITR